MTTRPVIGTASEDRHSESFRGVLSRLSDAQKTAKGSPAYSRFINRPTGRVFAAIAYRIGLRPNTVTAISGTFSLAGIALIAGVRPTPWTGVVIAALLAVGYSLDSADGQLARLQGTGSTVGDWLDHVIDSAKISALHLGVLISFYRFGYSDAEFELAIPMTWAFVATVHFFVIILNEQIRRAHGTTPPMVKSAPVLRSFLVAPTDYGVLLVTFAFYGYHNVFLWIYGLMLCANIAYMIAALHRWYREFAALR